MVTASTVYTILFRFLRAFLIMRACVLFVLRTLHKYDDIHTSPHTSHSLIWLKLQQGKRNPSKRIKFRKMIRWSYTLYTLMYY